jgi:hypothetical protein
MCLFGRADSRSQRAKLSRLELGSDHDVRDVQLPCDQPPAKPPLRQSLNRRPADRFAAIEAQPRQASLFALHDARPRAGSIYGRREAWRVALHRYPRCRFGGRYNSDSSLAAISR